MPIHDILPPIEIDDYTYLYVVGFILVLLALFILLYKTEKKGTKYYLRILDKCDFNDAKKTALQFSYYGKSIFIDEVTKTRFLKLKERLEYYKYIKNTTTLPQHLEDDIKQLIKQARVNHD
jgi:hypothetical protein